MSLNPRLARAAGWSAVISPILYIASIGVAIAGGESSPTDLALVSASTLLFLVVLAALYAAHRDAAPGLSLLGALAAGISSVAGLLLDPSTITPMLGAIGLLFAAGMLLLGWAALRSPGTPRGFGLLALVTGALATIQGLAAFAGASPDLFGLLNLLLTLPYVAWLLWLGRRWLAGGALPLQQPR